MRDILDAYRWMWHAISRWRPGPRWSRVLTFVMLALFDTLSIRWRPEVGLSLVVLGLGLVTWLPGRDGDVRILEASIVVSATGGILFEGHDTSLRELAPLLSRYEVERLQVEVDGAVTMGTLDQLHSMLVAADIRVSRFTMTPPTIPALERPLQERSLPHA
jgi:hypothetical protein